MFIEAIRWYNIHSYTAQALLSGLLVFANLLYQLRAACAIFLFFRSNLSCELRLSGFQCGKFEVITVTYVTIKVPSDKKKIK